MLSDVRARVTSPRQVIQQAPRVIRRHGRPVLREQGTRLQENIPVCLESQDRPSPDAAKVLKKGQHERIIAPAAAPASVVTVSPCRSPSAHPVNLARLSVR